MKTEISKKCGNDVSGIFSVYYTDDNKEKNTQNNKETGILNRYFKINDSFKLILFSFLVK